MLKPDEIKLDPNLTYADLWRREYQKATLQRQALILAQAKTKEELRELLDRLKEIGDEPQPETDQ